MYSNINIQNVKFDIDPIIDPLGQMICKKDTQDLVIMIIVKNVGEFQSENARTK